MLNSNEEKLVEQRIANLERLKAQGIAITEKELEAKKAAIEKERKEKEAQIKREITDAEKQKKELAKLDKKYKKEQLQADREYQQVADSQKKLQENADKAKAAADARNNYNETKRAFSDSFAKGKSLAERRAEWSQMSTGDKISGLIGALADYTKQLNQSIDNIAKQKSSIDTNLQGSRSKKYAGSYWEQFSHDIVGIAGVSPLIRQQDVVSNLSAAVNKGIAFNVEQRAFLETLKDKKAENLVVLDVKKLVHYTDYFIIATGNSTTHAQTLADAVGKLLKKPEEGIKQENDPQANWLLIDGGNFVLHVFQPNARKYYALEELWEDAERVEC